ncbi:NAD(P)/FAD-dependent oxidoreductase [Pinibacter soli]|uniref:NAD(P)/FAD-dependent oxidoreductase n=1 Tax=Pinibacter soli TaxID=3044211 RepID=A0ABT6R938_9BACT|nr:NAD(P)/FAD-dependent oxidoreductase [Pinibacter soli]MDI3318936.1 NAD(P)/FAD-dependent oxidoreductase [Pinibacter soli]
METNQTNSTSYDIAVIGGGLAGLSLSIQAARAGYKVILFEKETYPFHRVCGEYISLESWPFLELLGLRLKEMNLPIIKKLIVTSPDGSSIEESLPLGGFGISRYTIDFELTKIARDAGVLLLENAKVTDIVFENGGFCVKYNNEAILCQMAVGSFGKRSNLDVKWKRSFIRQKPNKLNNYIGIKYHIETNFPGDTIALHNFKNGYCGMSRVEGNKYCLCYLTTAANLKENDNSFEKLERNILFENPYLKQIFTTSKFLFSSPVTISQISFEKKSLIENHILMAGDACGMITPLCGNGMSMALHGSKIAFQCIDQFLQGKISRDHMEKQYIGAWNKQFSGRLQTGRLIQGMFGKEWMTNVFIKTIKPFPKLIAYLIRQTHGEPY